MLAEKFHDSLSQIGFGKLFGFPLSDLERGFARGHLVWICAMLEEPLHGLDLLRFNGLNQGGTMGQGSVFLCGISVD